MAQYKKLYPLSFKPILVGRVWGGDALVKRYHKALPVDDEGNPTGGPDALRVGESWELSAMDELNDSVVSEGFLADNTLSDILETYMGDLVGDKVFDKWGLHFPLLIKYLDVKDFLSVQVHPDDKTAIERYDSLGKTEMWYVMDASPDAKVYMGFGRDTDASEFYSKCQDGTAAELLNEIHPRKGDCFFIPSGTVHACGGGIVIAEIQEASDITFRLYDWGREHNPATARQMHLEEAIDCIDYRSFDMESNYVRSSDGVRLVADCDSFTAYTVTLDSPHRVSMENALSFMVYMCVEGSVSVQMAGASSTSTACDSYTLDEGGTLLIPASSDDFILSPIGGRARVLEAHISRVDEEADSYINPDVPSEVVDDRG